MHIVKGTACNAVPFTMCIDCPSFPYLLLWNICAMILVSLKSSKKERTSMAGSSAGRKKNPLGPGIVPGASRVSKLVGGRGSQRVDERDNKAGTKTPTSNISWP